MRDSLLPATRWSTSTPTRRCGPGPNARTCADEVVDAVERFDDDALDAQVVAPDPLEQRGVVHALDPDPAGRGRPGPRRRPPRRTRRRCAPRGLGGGGRRGGTDERHRPPVEQERGGQHREHPPLAVPVLERHGVALLAGVDGPPDVDDRAAERAVGGLDDEVGLGRAPRAPGCGGPGSTGRRCSRARSASLQSDRVRGGVPRRAFRCRLYPRMPCPPSVPVPSPPGRARGSRDW